MEAPLRRARDHPRWRTLIDQAEPYDPKPDREQRLHQLRERFGLPVNPSIATPSDAASSQDPKGKSRASTSALGPNYSPQEHTLRNDYSQHFVDTSSGSLPSNAVRNPHLSTRFDEYPKLKRLVQLKDSLVTRVAHPPTYLKADLRKFNLGSLIPVKYDVVLIDPPLEAYEWEGTPTASTSQVGKSTWTWDEVASLPIPQLAAKESFVFLWVGSGASDGLERGREVLARWGYRRCEDIVCIRTNPTTTHPEASSSSAFTRASQHCLMGIRGTIRRSTDAGFVHCNIDTDVILWDGAEEQKGVTDMVSKPPELYQIIENFCLGTRRLELFGRNRNLRRGWLTVGLEVGSDAPGWPKGGKVELPRAGMAVLEELGVDERLRDHLERLKVPRPYDKVEYDSNFGVDRPGCDLRDRSNLVPYVEEIDMLRPKSPPPRGGGEAHARSNQARVRAEQYHESPVLGGGGTMMPNGLSSHPALRTPQMEQPVMHGYATSAPAHPIAFEYPLSTTLPVRAGPGGAGLSGLGAGGARTVSVPSGSDTLSGPQASVLKAKAIAEAAAAASGAADVTSHYDQD